MSNFGNKLKEIRIKKNINQKQLSELLNVTQGAISQFENGYALPTKYRLEQICNILAISKDYFFPTPELEIKIIIDKIKKFKHSNLKLIHEYVNFLIYKKIHKKNRYIRKKNVFKSKFN